MADEWYYTRQGEEFGPVSSARLKQLVSDGKVQPNDMVWKTGMEKKVQAKTVKGLFGNGGSTGSTPDTRIPPPPSRRGRDEDDVAPVRPMDDEDDDRPRKKSDKKGGIPGWVWLVGGGVFLLCCCGGVGGGGYWIYYKINEAAKEVMGDGPSMENLKKLKAGMSQKEVEAILGPAREVKHFGPNSKTVYWGKQNSLREASMSFTNDRLDFAPWADMPDFDKGKIK